MARSDPTSSYADRAKKKLDEIREKLKEMQDSELEEPDGPLSGPWDELGLKRAIRREREGKDDECD